MRSEVIALRRELRRKDEFIATLGHELRNPLAVLTTASLIFKMDGATSADMKRAADIIGRQVQQVTRLINDLLDIERIDNGKLQLDLQPIDLRASRHRRPGRRCRHSVRTCRQHFEPFVQLSQSRTAARGGMGLGRPSFAAWRNFMAVRLT